MKTIAYLANSFPEPGEPYLWEEIRELRNRGRLVVACSFRKPRTILSELKAFATETHYCSPVKVSNIATAALLLIGKIGMISDLVWRAIRGPEPFSKRLRTLIHTWLGACLAAELREEDVGHIHVHHGYFASWSGMVAARLLNTTFSMTLHGSDLLVRADYIESKLKNCEFCVTVSDFNRDYVLERYPQVNPAKISVHRLGVDLDFWRPHPRLASERRFTILSVGRLHRVKNHEFLILACHSLKQSGLPFKCVIAGEGGQRRRLEELIHELHLEGQVELLGHVPRQELPALHAQADVFVLTSRSEGIPVAAMEAMAMERLVVAPKITGMPELIADKATGFLYRANSMEDFLSTVIAIHDHADSLDHVRRAARRQVARYFDRGRNLAAFAADFLQHLDAVMRMGSQIHEDPVLQQVQLSV